MSLVDNIRNHFEKRGFEVCSRMGDRMGIRPSRIRFFFVYTSFLTLGSPVILYFALHFVIQIKDYMRSKRTSVFDL